MADSKTKTASKSKASTKAPKAAAQVATAGEAEATKTLHRRTMTGIVVSDKMMKTRVVRVERYVKNTAYGKITTKMNKFKIHDENNSSKTGDLVSIIESRPLSRDKRWALQKILRKGSGEALTTI
jgi:small subunit ribosomal protein S17